MTVLAQLHAEPIGDITELKGYGQVLRGEPYPAVLDFNINSYDDVQTRAGRIGITFLDNSTVRLTEHSSLIIDEYIYDPNPNNSKMALQFASGTIRFVSGNLNKNRISLKTPTADIGVRGTDFTVTVDETGRSLIILLPNEFGDASGEIVVSTAMGQVVLNKPYQATTTSVYESTPTKPVKLAIDLNFIDNMLIISPPKEELSLEEESVIKAADFLEFNDLDVDFLEEDLLEEDPDFDFTELDIDYLNVNFLEDLLDILDLLDEEEETELLGQVSGVDIQGTTIGQDLETNITTIVDGDALRLMRKVTQNAELTLNSDQSYTVIFIQDGVSRTVKINGGSTSNITIIQGSG
tara:strand:+ start:11457 stop:12509 length:1053 start_codon:yes stop_codon:yes gene_type:complete